MANILTDYPEESDALLYVMSEDCNPKGWRVDLLVENLSSKIEEKLLLCSRCNGLLRDACICNGAFMCQVCTPEDMASQPVEMNRTIVNEKMIFCPLKWRGCVWSNNVNTAVHHLGHCLYFPEACPHGCVSLDGERKGKVVKVERMHIQEHVGESCPFRKIVCDFCEGEVLASEMNPHLEDCEEFPLPCPNRCSREGEERMRKLKRKQIPFHINYDCPLQIVFCPYWDHGCEEEMERRQTDKHEKEFLHVHLKLSTQHLKKELDTANMKIAMLERRHLEFLDDLTEVKKESVILERQSADKDEQIQSLSQMLFPSNQLPTGKLEWIIKGVKQKIQSGQLTYSDSFYVGLYKFASCISWVTHSTGIVVLTFVEKGNYDDELFWPIRYMRSVVLVNQIHSENNLVQCVEVPKEQVERHRNCFGRPTEELPEGFGRVFPVSKAEILQKKYCKQDSITLQITINLLP